MGKKILVALDHSDNAMRAVARDIVDESESGYDILEMGRRGISGIEEFFLGSVSQKVFSLAKNISILIVN